MGDMEDEKEMVVAAIKTLDKANAEKTYFSVKLVAFMQLLEARERKKLQSDIEKMIDKIWSDIPKQYPQMTSVCAYLDEMDRHRYQPERELMSIIIAAKQDDKTHYSVRLAVFEKRWKRNKILGG